MALQPPIFPIDQPIMPEQRQIGRRSSIDGLEKRLVAAVHQWLLGERRIGKTSVAKAVLARLRKQGSVAIDVDLTKLHVSTTGGLAGEIARQAQAAGAGEGLAGARRALGIARRQRSRMQHLGKALSALGYRDESEALAAVAGLLAGADDGAPGLGGVLGALALDAWVTERRAYLLLDEVHLLANLEHAESQVARSCREPESPIVFLLAGSEEASARALREGGRPLAALGQEFGLPPIAHEDWVSGLRARFAEAGVEIGELELDAIVHASRCHPRRTMLIASRVHASVRMQADAVATATLVELAIREAEGDRSWR